MTLVEESLSRVLTDRDRARSIVELRNGVGSGGKVHGLAPVIEGQRIGHGGAGDGDARGGPGLLRAFGVDLVAGHAGHCRLIGYAGRNHAPWTPGVDWLHQVADCAVEVRTVAAQAVVHQHAFGVMRGVGEYLGVGCTVRASMPAGEFVLVTCLAIRSHRRQVDIAQTDGLRDWAEDVDADMAQLGGEAGVMATLTRILADVFSVMR